MQGGVHVQSLFMSETVSGGQADTQKLVELKYAELQAIQPELPPDEQVLQLTSQE